MDLRKEHQNNLLKILWKALGPNLNEKNAARIAGTLDGIELILHNIDEDCKLSDRSSHRSIAKKEEAVTQIISDLQTINAFKYIRGREGHPSFPKFNANLFAGLDYRQLHNWIADLIEQWSAIYERK